MSSTKKTSVTHPKAVRSAESGRYVVADAGGWAVKNSAGGRASSVHRTQAEAVKAAREAVSSKGGALVVRGPDGLIKASYTVGREPFRKISAVEGIAPTGAAKTRAKQFTRSKLTSEERLKAIIEAHRPTKG